MEFFLIQLGLNLQNIPLRWLLNFPAASLIMVAIIGSGGVGVALVAVKVQKMQGYFYY